jgi:hypothetical protein
MTNKITNTSIIDSIRSLLRKAPVDMEKLEQDVTEILAKHPNLQELNLNCWDFGRHYLPAIMKALVKAPNLQLNLINLSNY